MNIPNSQPRYQNPNQNQNMPVSDPGPNEEIQILILPDQSKIISQRELSYNFLIIIVYLLVKMKIYDLNDNLTQQVAEIKRLKDKLYQTIKLLSDILKREKNGKYYFKNQTW